MSWYFVEVPFTSMFIILFIQELILYIQELVLREASLFMGQEWANFFRRAFRSGRKFLEGCFVVGEKFWVAKLAKRAISRYSMWANRPNS